MNQASYTVKEVAQRLELDIEIIYQQAIEGGIKLGVNARGWWGNWHPVAEGTGMLINTDSGHTDTNEQGIKLYAHNMPDGSLTVVKEFYISQFWYIKFSELYPLLTSHDKSAKEMCWFQPVNDSFHDPEKRKTYFPSPGVFWAHKEHNNKLQDLIIGLDDLRIYVDDMILLTKEKNSKQKLPSKQSRREDILKALIEALGIDKLRSLGRNGVWDELGAIDKSLFPPLASKTVNRFFDNQNLIAFKA